MTIEERIAVVRSAKTRKETAKVMNIDDRESSLGETQRLVVAATGGRKKILHSHIKQQCWFDEREI